jgi:hypothetical protein
VRTARVARSALTGKSPDPDPDEVEELLVSDPDPGLPNEFDVDPEMALGADEGGPEPVSDPVEDPEHQDYVEAAPHAVPVPEDAGR